MNEPTPDAVAHDWHARAMQGERVPVYEDEPQCGWFRRRLVRNGPWVPCIIWIERDLDERGDLASDERLRCYLDGEDADPVDQWVRVARNPISKAQYEHMMADRNWLRRHDETNPALATRTATPLHEAAGRL